MEESPLTRQPQPEVFKPKITQLYEVLFKDDDGHKSDGFWTEFFLLRPEPAALRRVLNGLGPGDALLRYEARTRELFARSRDALAAGQSPANLHALETLRVFLPAVFSRKYTHPSSAVISALTGIDRVDAAFSDFIGILDGMIRNHPNLEMRQRTVAVTLAVTAGAHQTSLLTYLMQKDLFPSVVKFIHEAESPERITQAFCLLGLLANYNKFELRNPYQTRLADFVNETTIRRVIHSVGVACRHIRAGYTDIQDDLPEQWTILSMLGLIGLGSRAAGAQRSDRRPSYDAEAAKLMFAKQPRPEVAVLLATYDFTHTNKLFCFNLVTLPSERLSRPESSQPVANGSASLASTSESAFASFLSLTSYLLQHAHASARGSLYAHLNLTVLRLLVEDAALCKRLCAPDADGRMQIRLCRQRAPHLPLVRGGRIPAAALLDVVITGVDHNLRRRLDVGLYSLCVGIMLRVIAHLARARARLSYHWGELFRSLLGLIRFLTTYASDFQDIPAIGTLLDLVVNTLALSLSAGEAFLSSAAEYDDLFYKVVEAGDTLSRFHDVYSLSSRGSNSIDTLTSISAHYNRLLAGGKEGDPSAAAAAAPKAAPKIGLLTSSRVAEVIKEGYETLSIRTNEGLDSWEGFREADERNLLKKLARATVADVKELLDTAE